LQPFVEEPKRHKSNWLRQETRKNSEIMTKIMLNFRPYGKERLARASEKTVTGDRNRSIKA
jgi:hypothetical protein